MYQINVHANCPCNELVSLTNRHLVDRTNINFDKALWRKIANQTHKFYPQNLQPCRYDDVIDAYTGTKKRMYYNAKIRLIEEGLQDKHKIVSMFVKPDRYPEGDIMGKDPRAIQYRTPEFNLELGVYIKSYEHALYPSLTMGVVSRTRVIAKGLNNYDRAELLLSKIDCFSNPRFVLLDHSRFDSTINEQHLRTTHKHYQRAFNSRKLAKLLRAQISNTGYTKCGIKYRTRGTRMSGDPDTGCGNSVVNADCLWGFLTYSGIKKFDFLLDGDDSVVIIEKDEVSKLDRSLFERMGFSTKMEIVADMDEIEFCQCKIILAKRPVFSRNPSRAFSHSATARKAYPNHIWKHWLAAVGSCELASNLGVPVLQAYGQSLRSLSTTHFVDPEMRYVYTSVQHGLQPIEVTEDARLTFGLAWGIPWDVQELIEGYDFTSNAYICEFKQRSLSRIPLTKFKHEYAALATRAWAIRSAQQLAPESSGRCWWRSCTPRVKRPWTGCQ